MSNTKLKGNVIKLLISLDWRLTQIENSYRDGFYTQIEYINKAKKEIAEFKETFTAPKSKIEV